MGKTKQVNSHVQNSKSIIKEFGISANDGNTYVINVPNKTIEIKGPEKIGVIKGYFDKDGEKFLCKAYETPLGNVISKIKTNSLNGAVVKLNVDEINIIADFLVMLLVREPSIIVSTLDKTIIAKMIGYNPTHTEFIKKVEIQI